MYQHEIKDKIQTNDTTANQSIVKNIPEQTTVPISTKNFFNPLSRNFNIQSSINNSIPSYVKNRFEVLSGFSFEDIKVHYNSDKPHQLQAFAYTQGNEVYIGPGQEQYLEHELGHVVQQKQGIVKPTSELNGVAINDDTQLEKNADEFMTSGISESMHSSNNNVGVVQRMKYFPPRTNKEKQVTSLAELNEVLASLYAELIGRADFSQALQAMPHKIDSAIKHSALNLNEAIEVYDKSAMITLIEQQVEKDRKVLGCPKSTKTFKPGEQCFSREEGIIYKVLKAAGYITEDIKEIVLAHQGGWTADDKEFVFSLEGEWYIFARAQHPGSSYTEYEISDSNLPQLSKNKKIYLTGGGMCYSNLSTLL